MTMEMTDQELREKLTSFGVDVGPIVDSTRRLYKNKLARLLGEPEIDAGEQIPIRNHNEDMDELPPTQPVSDSSPDLSFCANQSRKDFQSANDFLPDGSSKEDDTKELLESVEDTVSGISPTFLIRARKPIHSVPRTSTQSSNYYEELKIKDRLKKNDSADSSHLLKFVCFIIVVAVIAYFVQNQEPIKQFDK